MNSKPLRDLLGSEIVKLQRVFGGEILYISPLNDKMVRLQQLDSHIYSLLIDNLRGMQIYVPKIAAAEITTRELLEKEPDAPVWMVMSVCNVSRITYFRTKKELKNESRISESRENDPGQQYRSTMDDEHSEVD